MDNIVELTMVMYDGEVKKLSSSQNPDLWWAARGAGKSYTVTDMDVSI